MTLISATNHVGNDYIVMYETILATKMSISATDYIGHVHIGQRSKLGLWKCRTRI